MIDEELIRSFPDLNKHSRLRHEIANQSISRTFNEGDVLLKEGGFVKYVPLVLSGLIKVYTEDDHGNELLLYYISKGESCMMSATYCIQNERSNVKAIVEEEAEIVLVPARAAVEFSTNHVGWNAFFFDLFKSRYNELIHIISLLTFGKKDNRLIDYLFKEQAVKGSKTLHTTHQKIADDLGATREVISRLLKKLENDGILTLEHRKIILK